MNTAASRAVDHVVVVDWVSCRITLVAAGSAKPAATFFVRGKNKQLREKCKQVSLRQHHCNPDSSSDGGKFAKGQERLSRFPPVLESGYGLLSNRFCVARNSAEGGFGGCAREFAIRID